MDTFVKLKKGHRIRDSWYGLGWVKSCSKQRVVVQLDGQRLQWKYDRAHINKFVKLAFKGAK